MKKIILSALAIVAMASCSKENEAMMPNDGEVRICSSIATRTVGNTWESGDAIGVYMTTNGGEFGTLGKNVKYTTATTNGNFTSTSPLYFPATGNVDLIAYYPYNATDYISAYPVVNVTNQPEDQGSIDLMKAEASNVAKNSAAVNMTFKHKLARIKLNIKNGDGVTKDALANLAVTLKGTDTEATYDLTKADDASPITLGGVVDDIEMLIAAGTDPYVRSAEAIVIPQELNGATLTFKTSDNTYISTLETKAFTIGNEYIYNVTIKKTAVAISSPTIDTWGPGNDGEEENLDALLPEPDLDIAFKNGTYEIYTAKGLEAFASIVNNDETDVSKLSTKGINNTDNVAQNVSANGKLMNDINLVDICYKVDGDAESDKSWTPIGNFSNTYAGTFNGGGYLVSGLYINTTTDYQGLFGYISGATIESIGVSGDVILSSNTRAGGIVGQAVSSSEITECYFLGTVSSAASNGYAGGIAGAASLSTLTRCYNSGAIEGSGTYANVGGIVGSIGGSTVAACYNSGTVTGSNTYSPYVGGVVGKASSSGSTYSTVKSCYSYGSVSSANSSYLGGVVGLSINSSTISYCYYDTDKVDNSYVDQQTNTPQGAVNGSNDDANYVGGLTTEMMTKTSSTTGSLLYYLSQSEYYSDYWISSLFSSINNGYPIFSWQLEE